MNPLSGTELNTEAYSALFTLHNTMKAGEYANCSMLLISMFAKRIPNKNPDYRSDNKMAYRPIGRIMFRIKHMLHEDNNTSLASPKIALPKDLEGHSQKILLSLVQ